MRFNAFYKIQKYAFVFDLRGNQNPVSFIILYNILPKIEIVENWENHENIYSLADIALRIIKNGHNIHFGNI